MVPTYREYIIPKDLNEIPFTSIMARAIRSLPESEWKTFFQFIRLSLASRIGSTKMEELATLQGKIKGIEEIEQLFLKLFQKSS